MRLKRFAAALLSLLLIFALCACEVVSNAPLSQEDFPPVVSGSETSSAPSSQDDTPVSDSHLSKSDDVSSEPPEADAEENDEEQTGADDDGADTYLERLDIYELSPSAEAYLGEYSEQYRQFIDAIIARKEKITLPEENDFDKTLAVYGAVRSSVCGEVIESMTMSAGSRTVKINYRYSSAEQQQILDYYRNEIPSILGSIISPEDTEAAKALAVYDYVAQKFMYDYDELYRLAANEDAENLPTWQCMQSGRAVCDSYTQLMVWLLEQMDIEAYYTSGTVGDASLGASTAHAWVIAKLDGEYYHIDPTAGDYEYREPTLNYFALSDTERAESGAQSGWLCSQYYGDASSPACQSDAFAPIHTYRRNHWFLDAGDLAICEDGTMPSLYFSLAFHEFRDDK